MRRLTLSLFVLGALILPLSAHAVAPASVTGIAAEVQEDGSVKVRWSPLLDATVTAYRIYLSQKSILENEGAYDDFETTSGPVSEHILTEIDRSLPMVYVSVMAVGAAGEESTYFVEEASVALPPSSSESSAASSSSEESSSESSSEEPVPAVTLHLLSAKALSPTQVALEFSSVPLTSSDPQALIIKDPMGTELFVTQVTPEGATLVLETNVQAMGVVYEVRLNDSITGENGLTLDTIDRSAFFSGHATGTIADATSSADGMPGDVTNFTLQSTPQADGRYLITAQWQLAAGAPPPAAFIVRQSRDGGKTFGDAESLPSSVAGATIPDVTPEDFGLAVYVMDARNRLSGGVFQSISPPTGITQTAGTPASVITTPIAQVTSPGQTPPQKTPLSQTGAGFGLIVTALAGGLLGWRKMRAKKELALA